eukprot:scaffold21834_cov123-Isochrysis_galbana.AAC.4
MCATPTPTPPTPPLPTHSVHTRLSGTGRVAPRRITPVRSMAMRRIWTHEHYAAHGSYGSLCAVPRRELLISQSGRGRAGACRSGKPRSAPQPRPCPCGEAGRLAGAGWSGLPGSRPPVRLRASTTRAPCGETPRVGRPFWAYPFWACPFWPCPLWGWHALLREPCRPTPGPLQGIHGPCRAGRRRHADLARRNGCPLWPVTSPRRAGGSGCAARTRGEGARSCAPGQPSWLDGRATSRRQGLLSRQPRWRPDVQRPTRTSGRLTAQRAAPARQTRASPPTCRPSALRRRARCAAAAHPGPTQLRGERRGRRAWQKRCAQARRCHSRRGQRPGPPPRARSASCSARQRPALC